jgi:hypothetical protein
MDNELLKIIKARLERGAGAKERQGRLWELEIQSQDRTIPHTFFKTEQDGKGALARALQENPDAFAAVLISPAGEEEWVTTPEHKAANKKRQEELKKERESLDGQQKQSLSPEEKEWQEYTESFTSLTPEIAKQMADWRPGQPIPSQSQAILDSINVTVSPEEAQSNRQKMIELQKDLEVLAPDDARRKELEKEISRLRNISASLFR